MLVAISASMPNQANHILIYKLSFRCSQLNSVTENRMPAIVLYNPTNSDIIADRWRINDNSGKVITLPHNKKLKSKKFYTFRPQLKKNAPSGLQYAGDRLVLQDRTGNVVDAMSWENDTTQLNPPLSGAAEGVSYTRKQAGADTDTFNDWKLTYKQCCNCSQTDNEDGGDPHDDNGDNCNVSQLPLVYTLDETESVSSSLE